MAKDDEYDEDVELEKLRRRRFVFLPAGVVCTSSSVSSSVVLLFALRRMFKRRFRGARLPLLVVAVVLFVDDDDVSDLRLVFIAKNNAREEKRKRISRLSREFAKINEENKKKIMKILRNYEKN